MKDLKICLRDLPRKKHHIVSLEQKDPNNLNDDEQELLENREEILERLVQCTEEYKKLL